MTDEDDDLFAPGSMRVVVYAAMLAATICGQLLGIGADGLLHVHTPVLPVVCSVVLEGIAGARLGARSGGYPLDRAESARLSGVYSLALVALTVPLAFWVSLSVNAPADAPPLWTATRVAGALAVLTVATVARWGIMLAFTPKRAGAGAGARGTDA
jgi:hypothetical protein